MKDDDNIPAGSMDISDLEITSDSEPLDIEEVELDIPENVHEQETTAQVQGRFVPGQKNTVEIEESVVASAAADSEQGGDAAQALPEHVLRAMESVGATPSDVGIDSVETIEAEEPVEAHVADVSDTPALEVESISLDEPEVQETQIQEPQIVEEVSLVEEEVATPPADLSVHAESEIPADVQLEPETPVEPLEVEPLEVEPIVQAEPEVQETPINPEPEMYMGSMTPDLDTQVPVTIDGTGQESAVDDSVIDTGETLPTTYNAMEEAAQSAGAGTALKTYNRDLTTLNGEEEADDGLRKKGRMGDRMVELGLITESQLHVALHEKNMGGKMLGEVMVELGFIDEETLTAFLAESSGYEVFDPKHTIFDGDTLALLEKDMATKHKVLPISVNDGEVRVAMADPYDVVALDTLRRFLPKELKIKPMVSTAAILNDAIDAAYGYASSVSAILKELENTEGDEEIDLSNLDDDEAFSHPIVRLVNALVFEAVKIGASDLHFEPEENFVRLRYRKDGTLFTAQILHKQHWSGISQRIKIMSNMNIADKMSPQDGRFGMNVNGREADFRVSSLPTVHGENIVLRVLDQSSSIMPMEKLGFSDHNLRLIKESQAKPEGIIIVTGPTGSGKTTSLYSMLNEINTVDVNIQTLEDPVEYSLPMIRQTHVREGVLEFADGIKALLRQDPDIIFIGEIRDGETAGMALKAAMTGHQVYTTLHTNDSFGAIPRLFDLGLKPGMVAGAIVSIFAQRLTRCLCPSCKEAYTPDAAECALMNVDPENPPQIFRARQGGCDLCEGQGYKGRTAVVEILKFDEDIDELMARGESKADIKALALKKGFKSMKDDGIIKVLEGMTSLEAIAKVVDITK